MATPQRPRPRSRPQLARINAMKKSSYSAKVGLDALAASGGELDVGGEFASQTSFRIRGGRGGAEVAALFRKLGLSGPEDFTIPPAVYASRRRPSLEASPGAGAGAEGSSSSPPEIPEISGRDVMVATRTETAGDGEEARLAIKLVQSEVVEAFARTYEGSGAESSSRLVESEKVEASRREVAAAPKQDNADEDKEDDKLTKVDKLREERREVVVEATRENAGALVLVVSESTSRDIEHLVSPSPNRRFRRTITSWLKGEHLGSGSFGSVYEAISDDGFFFAVKEVSLVDQGINAKQRILQLEHEISLLSRLEHENIVRYFGTDKVAPPEVVRTHLITFLVQLFSWSMFSAIHGDICNAEFIGLAESLVDAEFGVMPRYSWGSVVRSVRTTSRRTTSAWSGTYASHTADSPFLYQIALSRSCTRNICNAPLIPTALCGGMIV